VAYLASPGDARAVFVRAYSGEAKLGPVGGRLVVEHAPPDAAFAPAGEVAFDLAADTWAELSAPIPAGPGRVRLTVGIGAPRVPRDVIPGSQDTRRLGLAVKRLWLA